MKRLLIGTLAGLAIGAPTAPADNNEKQLNEKSAWAATLVTRVKPGETATWRSRPIGKITALSLVVNGSEMAYELKPRTNACVGYAYGEGVAVRLTDCAKGKRVPYVRIRAANAGIEPAMLKLRFSNR